VACMGKERRVYKALALLKGPAYVVHGADVANEH
jgi:hypothetical protein